MVGILPSNKNSQETWMKLSVCPVVHSVNITDVLWTERSLDADKSHFGHISEDLDTSRNDMKTLPSLKSQVKELPTRILKKVG
ncbi:hypothetical protein HNY73_007120 [Argiope bruennichi]|uniref:Uncharacterized protein n=1 Tax=Argiope bruennichi TaxID=94029 RepID=A0A8T0FFH0_ARGBR|nr:hypothetical protein HNY73_007120 [Argiope bruennichi]